MVEVVVDEGVVEEVVNSHSVYCFFLKFFMRKD